MGKASPKHHEHNAHGSSKKPFGARDDKAALLARMKAAQAKKDATTEDATTEDGGKAD